jgi:hypothetical protein
MENAVVNRPLIALKIMTTILILFSYLVLDNIIVDPIIAEISRQQLNGGTALATNFIIWKTVKLGLPIVVSVAMILTWWDQIKGFLGWMKEDTEIKVGK